MRTGYSWDSSSPLPSPFLLSRVTNVAFAGEPAPEELADDEDELRDAEEALDAGGDEALDEVRDVEGRVIA